MGSIAKLPLGEKLDAHAWKGTYDFKTSCDVDNKMKNIFLHTFAIFCNNILDLWKFAARFNTSRLQAVVDVISSWSFPSVRTTEWSKDD